jgi:hypothetical protein
LTCGKIGSIMGRSNMYAIRKGVTIINGEYSGIWDEWRLERGEQTATEYEAWLGQDNQAEELTNYLRKRRKPVSVEWTQPPEEFPAKRWGRGVPAELLQAELALIIKELRLSHAYKMRQRAIAMHIQLAEDITRRIKRDNNPLVREALVLQP